MGKVGTVLNCLGLNICYKLKLKFRKYLGCTTITTTAKNKINLHNAILF